MKQKLFRLALIFLLMAAAWWQRPGYVPVELPEPDNTAQIVFPDGINPALKQAFLERYELFGQMAANPVMTFIDYSLPSTEPRLWAFDPATGKVLLHSLVAHGQQTGENQAVHFSNRDGSHQSSLGFYLTDEVYHGNHGLSLRLRGLEEGINDRAFDRAIVIHGADYVSDDFIRQHGRLGRSHGCPALPHENVPEFIRLTAKGSLIFVYHPEYLALLQSVSQPVAQQFSELNKSQTID
ncbi:MAG: murein L,D-transpeptidase catalytic domain family protein [Bacteroidetes bacterium]|nr:murein L,D-transpeptidase catalytic domain family protein [Bacteroidota bacterium]